MEEIESLVNENTIEQTDSFKYLGVKLNETMEWSDHIDYIHSKVAKRLGLLKRVKHLLPVKSREIMYNTMIQPILDYGDIVWGDRFNQTQMDRLQVLQNKAAKIILNKPVYSSSTSALASLGWKTLKVRRQFHRSLFFLNVLKICQILTSTWLTDLLFIITVPVLVQNLEHQSIRPTGDKANLTIYL